MNIRIIAYEEKHIEAVKRFNKRLKAGGSPYQFPESNIPHWLPNIDKRSVYQQFFLALDGDEVRGAYIHKHQDFRVAGKTMSVGNYGFPLSEGTVNSEYKAVGKLLLADMLEKQPMTYVLGIGGYRERLAWQLRKGGWAMTSTPFFLRIMKPYNFFRNVTYLRNSPARRFFADFLASSGVGWIAARILQGVRTKGFWRPGELVADTFNEFDKWSDDIWDTCQHRLIFSAVRNAQALNILYPGEKAKFIKMRLGDGDKAVGWAVMLATQMETHKHFGGMKLGSLVDCLALPGYEHAVVRESIRALREHEVDLIVSNQSYAAWREALSKSGFLSGPSNHTFALSPGLTEMIAPFEVNYPRFHINRGDGGGPIHL
jgi:hypothetical protein